ncbi:MAG: alpha-glucan family phosphorylase [Myxococcota bacterium]
MPAPASSGIVRDPVCGMRLPAALARAVPTEHGTVHVCSDLCREAVLADPARFAAPAPPPAPRIAWFSMEIGLWDEAHTYAGGLGVLAGDLAHSCADLGVPLVAVSLVHHLGYFRQRVDGRGRQVEGPDPWEPAAYASPVGVRVTVSVEGRDVAVTAWRLDVEGMDGAVVPVLLLDTRLPENAPEDQALTDTLYGGDARYRLAQEVVLGVGGARIVRALGFPVERYHMNEGQAALLAVELLRERGALGAWDYEGVRKRCVFTTHTPVAAGHDQFEWALVERVVGGALPMDVLRMLSPGDRLNMTALGLSLSHLVNGVAHRHGEVARRMFPAHRIDAITNGVHPTAWTCAPMREVFDRHVPGWERDPSLLRRVLGISAEDIEAAHRDAKRAMLDEVRRRTGRRLRDDALTLGFARRFTPYKRPELLLSDAGALAAIAREVGPLQILFAGKAHPRDEEGREAIRWVCSAELGEGVTVLFVPAYDLALARRLASGCDLWVNTPRPPMEASGTSGMKAAFNGVPQLSTLDGWWEEGLVEGVTGWGLDAGEDDALAARNHYRKLGVVIAPAFYRAPARYAEVRRGAIALNASWFNSHRVAQQYAACAWL